MQEDHEWRGSTWRVSGGNVQQSLRSARPPELPQTGSLRTGPVSPGAYLQTAFLRLAVDVGTLRWAHRAAAGIGAAD